MASEDEFRRRLAELSTRMDSLEDALQALRSAPSAAEVEATAAERDPWRSVPVASAPLPLVSGDEQGQAQALPGREKDLRSLENRIGSQLLNRVGILAILLGTAWFLKLALDRSWIGPGVRILAGLAAAAALMAWSESFRSQGFPRFAHMLKALGAGIAYLSLWAAFALYHLAPAWMVFLAMVVVTVANAWMAWRQNSELLAAYALAGGMATPALLSIGENSEAFLFSYLLLLGYAALLSLAVRPWKRLVAGAFAGTVVYLVAWSIPYYQPSAFLETLTIVSLFFAGFACAAFLIVREVVLRAGAAGEAAAPSESDSFFLAAFPMVNAGVFFAALMALSDGAAHRGWRPAAAILLAFVFWVMAGIRGVSPGFRSLAKVHLGLGIFFLTIAVPLQFHGYGITLCWLAESLGLLAVAAARSLAAMRIAGAVVLWLAACDVILLEWLAPPHGPVATIANAHFYTSLAAAAVFAGVTRLSLGAIEVGRAREASQARTGTEFGSWRYLAGFGTVAFSLTVLVSITLEIHHEWFCGASFFHDLCGPLSEAGRAMRASLELSVWYMVYGAALMAVGFWRRSGFLRWQALILLALSIGKVFLMDGRHLSQGYRVLSFFALGVLLLAISFLYQKDWLRLRSGRA